MSIKISPVIFLKETLSSFLTEKLPFAISMIEIENYLDFLRRDDAPKHNQIQTWLCELFRIHLCDNNDRIINFPVISLPSLGKYHVFHPISPAENIEKRKNIIKKQLGMLRNNFNSGFKEFFQKKEIDQGYFYCKDSRGKPILMTINCMKIACIIYLNENPRNIDDIFHYLDSYHRKAKGMDKLNFMVI